MFDIVNLWNKNKVLFIVLLPIVIAVFIVKFILGGANTQDIIDTVQDVNNAQNQDNDLSNQSTAANTESNSNKQEADKIEEKIKEIRESDGDEDWHKRRRSWKKQL